MIQSVNVDHRFESRTQTYDLDPVHIEIELRTHILDLNLEPTHYNEVV